MAYHDLRPPEISSANPLDLGCLLGLGLKFCIQEERPRKDVLERSFERFKRDTRLRYFFAGSIKNEQCNKKIYIKSSWDPGNANKTTKDMLSLFQSKLAEERKISHARPRATNLSKHQYSILNHIQSTPSIIVIQCDKKPWTRSDATRHLHQRSPPPTP